MPKYASWYTSVSVELFWPLCHIILYFETFLGPTSKLQGTLLSLTLFDMGGGARGAQPPGKHTSGTFMSSNDLVTHQTHKNG